MVWPKQTFTFDDFSQRKIERTIIFSSGFLLAKNQVLCVLIGCNRQLLLIKIYAGISNIFKKVHHLLKLRACNKGIKQMLFLLFLNFLKVGSSSSLYITIVTRKEVFFLCDYDIAKTGNWGKVNFSNFRTLFMDKFAAFFWLFFIIKWEKQSDRENKTCCNGRHWLHWGSLCSCKTIVIIKMNKMLYF